MAKTPFKMKGWSPFTKVTPLKQNEEEEVEEEEEGDGKKGGSAGQWAQGAMNVASTLATGVRPVR